MLGMIKNAEESQRIKDLGEETQQEVRQLIVDTLGEEIKTRLPIFVQDSYRIFEIHGRECGDTFILNT